jgi:hypothetical protein
MLQSNQTQTRLVVDDQPTTKSYILTLEETFSFAQTKKIVELTSEQSKAFSMAILNRQIVHSEFSNNIRTNWRVKKIEINTLKSA